MTRTKKAIATLGSAMMLGATLAALPATAASASGGCSGSLITINSGGGAEAPSRAYGHRHSSGNHYIRLRSGDYLVWYADNNGGWDGDTRDTLHTITYCA